MRSAIRVLVLVIAVLCAISAPAQAGDWTVGEITGPSGTTRIEPTAVNASGVVVGQARFAGKTLETAFRWEDGVMIELAIPGGLPYTRALDINDEGTIVGYAGAEQPCCTLQYSVNGAMWTATKTTSGVTLTPYNTFGSFATTGTHKDHGSTLRGINNHGQVVGGAAFEWVSPFNNPNNNPSYTIFPTVGTFSRLALPDTLNAQTGGAVYGGWAHQINDGGDIMGVAGPGATRVWHGGGGKGTTYDVYDPGGHGFNDAAHIAGRTAILSGSLTNQDYRALLWNGTDYVRIGAAQSQSIANALNNSDWAVGRAGVFMTTQPRTTGDAWLWRPDEAATPLYALAPTGWSMANATDINDDGMIVGSGKHGNVEMGYWMAPASIAHKLSGTVYGPTGNPVAGAQLRIIDAAGNQLATPVTGADGTYSATLNRGGPYDITVLPEGAYRPDGLAGCTLVVSACRLNLGKNRTVDFYGINIVVPDPKDTGPGGPPNVPKGPAAPPASLKGPAFSIPSKNKTLSSSAGGVVGFGLAAFSAPATGTITLQTAGKVKASAKASVLALGKATFTAKKGKALTVKIKLAKKARALLKKQRTIKAVAVVTAKIATGGVTTKRYTLTIKAPRRR
jgi:probable HAF family extracellular repeat protein